MRLLQLINNSRPFFSTWCFWLVICVVIASCAPMRTAVPPDTIPQARMATTDDEQYGHAVLTELSKRWELDYNDARFSEITEVVDKVTHAAHADAAAWHIYLFKDDSSKNAAATRGNHVFIWSGMLHATQDADELATVLAHEIAHVVAGHTEPDPNEELRRILINVGAMAAGIAVQQTTKNPNMAQNLGRLTQSVTGEVGSGFLVYPYSRELEYEADRIGMTLMAEAGYNPEKAVRFWERASNDPDFSSSFEFLSSHPLASDRLQALRRNLPTAVERYRKATGVNQYANPLQISENVPISSSSWRVISNKAVVYTRPDRNSLPIGEFVRGARVSVVNEMSDWLEINNPDYGFLEKLNLVQEK